MVEKYNVWWRPTVHPLQVEIDCIRMGGRWGRSDGKIAGMGMAYHYRRFVEILWPEVVWHKWNLLILDAFVDHRIIGIMGPASSSKTHTSSLLAMVTYYCFPSETTIIVSSTTRESLENRILGELKKFHRSAKSRLSWLPGNLIEGRQRIVTDDRSIAIEGRDFRNGIVGVSCFCDDMMVDTPKGPMRISSVVTGQEVNNACGTGTIKSTHKRLASRVIRVSLSDGRKIDCTEEHPFFTLRGWIKAIDLETSDMVLSVSETMSILWESYPQQHYLLFGEVPELKGMPGMRKTNRSGLSKPEVLLNRMQGQNQGAPVQTMREKVQGMAKKGLVDRTHDGTLLQPGMLREVGCGTQGVLSYRDDMLQALWEENGGCSFPAGILLCGMPTAGRADALREVRQEVLIQERQAQRSQVALLRQVLQAELDWLQHEQAPKPEANARGAIRLETISKFDPSVSPNNRAENQAQPSALATDRYCVPGDKAGRGDRWRGSLDAGEKGKGRYENGPFGGTRVDSVEVLEPSGDPRFDKSAGGYWVYNLEVDGHPSYSVNGVVVHNCKKGQSFQGIEEFVGVKNKKVMLVADELQFLPSVFLDSIANMNKNKWFRCLGLGNPKDITDALGRLCEPAAHIGGWDSGIDQTNESKVWETRFSHGVCVHLPGPDSPNLDGKLGIPLITQEQMDSDVAFYGKDSIQWAMMDCGRMPRGLASRRVITRQMCLKFRALEDPVWKDTNRKKIGFLDAAYRGVGGDRCVFGWLEFGEEASTPTGSEVVSAILSQSIISPSGNQVLALAETMVVPVKLDMTETPEDQIAQFVKGQCESIGIDPSNFFFDSTGRGSLMNAFGRLWSPLVNGVEFGGAASKDRKVSADIDVVCYDHYFNMVTELWFNASYLIQSGQFRGMTEDVMAEGCMREWGWQGKRIQVETKDKMKIKSGRSCDLFDSLVVGVEGARRRGFIIKRQAAVAHKRVDNRWKRDLKERAEKLWHGSELNHAA